LSPCGVPPAHVCAQFFSIPLPRLPLAFDSYSFSYPEVLRSAPVERCLLHTSGHPLGGGTGFTRYFPLLLSALVPSSFLPVVRERAFSLTRGQRPNQPPPTLSFCSYVDCGLYLSTLPVYHLTKSPPTTRGFSFCPVRRRRLNPTVSSFSPRYRPSRSNTPSRNLSYPVR